MANSQFLLPVVCCAAGCVLFWLIELGALPRRNLRRPAAATLLFAGIWGFAYSILLFATGRPMCAALFALAMEAILVLVDNAKYRSLREPFLYQDYDYFLDTLKFPRLFLPFLGVKSFLLAAAGCFLGFGVLWLEDPPPNRWRLDGQAGGGLLIALASLLCLWFGHRAAGQISLKPGPDAIKYGFIPFLWLYGREEKKSSLPESPFARVRIKPCRETPHLIAIQSESFFDARLFFGGVKKELYRNLDEFDRNALLWGDLIAPAWGANTVRTECCFLTGIPPAALGARQFNPYQSMARGWNPASLPRVLRRAGYQTICVHPYYGQFYGRDKIFPRLGFDAFLDIKKFSRSPDDGPYIGDRTLGEKIIELIEKATRPTFVFAITMENHGPLGLERPLPSHALFYDRQPPRGCEELGIYLNHVRSCDNTLGLLRDAFGLGPYLSLCFYGDHAPILEECYRTLPPPSGHTPYFCWSNRARECQPPNPERAENLAVAWLKALDLIRGKEDARP
ncbi:MAG: LTA synthase family protein [Desulfovibrio sp.]|nr:LTA synthase family protein [Desulfovibrio sp.]